MSWEQRGKQRYYYRTRRVGGRVVRVYFGRGEEAETAAKEDARRLERRLLVRQWLRDMKEMRHLGRLRLKVIRIARLALKLHEQDIAAGLVPDERMFSPAQCQALRAEIEWRPPVEPNARWPANATGSSAAQVVAAITPGKELERQRVASREISPKLRGQATGPQLSELSTGTGRPVLGFPAGPIARRTTAPHRAGSGFLVRARGPPQ